MRWVISSYLYFASLCNYSDKKLHYRAHELAFKCLRYVNYMRWSGSCILVRDDKLGRTRIVRTHYLTPTKKIQLFLLDTGLKNTCKYFKTRKYLVNTNRYLKNNNL